MAILHLIVGLPCAGKTTFAKQLELEQHALRFTPDEWHTRLFGLDLEHPEHDARHGLIETIIWDVAARALQLETNVIHFLNVPEAELLSRLEIRNANLPAGTFRIPASKLLEWMQIFQAPSEDELEK